MALDRRSRAVASLHGLSVGDALGSCFFIPDNQTALATRQLPPDPWWWTDDTEMACSIVTTLNQHGHIDQDALAASFARRHDFDRGYGPGVNRMLRLIRQENADWRQLAAESWDGRGSWGNGAAMRVAPLGAYFADDPHRAATEAALSAEVTHTHPEGVAGAAAHIERHQRRMVDLQLGRHSVNGTGRDVVRYGRDRGEQSGPRRWGGGAHE